MVVFLQTTSPHGSLPVRSGRRQLLEDRRPADQPLETGTAVLPRTHKAVRCPPVRDGGSFHTDISSSASPDVSHTEHNNRFLPAILAEPKQIIMHASMSQIQHCRTYLTN